MNPGLVLSMTALAASLTAISAHAQQSDTRNPVYEIARNKIGLLRYCRDKGLVDRTSADEALSTEERSLQVLSSLAGPYNQAAGDEAEKRGETGIYGAGSQMPIANMAKTFDTTPEGLCKEWVEDSVNTLRTFRIRKEKPTGAAPQ
jgi:hypothetical protein